MSKDHTEDDFPYGATEPFENVQALWFWFIDAQQARNDGARCAPDAGAVVRPCEPVDILKILDRLYRARRLTRDHLHVLRHYGRRHMAPDPRRVKEGRAYYIWHEALGRLRPVLERKRIVLPQRRDIGLDYGHNDDPTVGMYQPRSYHRLELVQ